ERAAGIQAALDEMWRRLLEGDLELRVAQNVILEDGNLYLRQLPLHAPSRDADREAVRRLGELLQDWDRVRDALAQAREAPERNRQAALAGTRKDEEAVRERLRSLLEDEGQTAAYQLLRQAVCDRIGKHYAYKPTSVPFELFQNADDACAELAAKPFCTTP